MTETYQDIRVTVGHEFGSKEYHTKRVKFACRGLFVLAPAIRVSSLCCGVTRQLLMASRRVQLWSAVKFGSGKNISGGRIADRMELSGSLSVFGYSHVDIRMDDVVRVSTEAKWSLCKRLLSELACLVACLGAAETPLRVIYRSSLSCSFEEAGSAPGVRGEDESWVLDKKVLTSCFPLTRTNFLGLVTSYLRLILRSCLTFFIG